MSNNDYILPRFLFEPKYIGLTNEAKILYALLIDCQESDRKYDENKSQYLIFNREAMQYMLGLSSAATKRTLIMLEQHSLVKIVRRQSFPNKIYLLSPDSKTTATAGEDSPESDTVRLKKRDTKNRIVLERSKIIAIKFDGDYTSLTTASGETRLKNYTQKYLQNLLGDSFISCGERLLVNSAFISRVDLKERKIKLNNLPIWIKFDNSAYTRISRFVQDQKDTKTIE